MPAREPVPAKCVFSAGELLAVLPEPSASAMALAGHEFAGLRRTRTAHFVILHDVEESRARALARLLESTYRAHVRWARLLDLPIHPPAAKLAVLLRTSEAAYTQTLRRRGLAGDGALALFDEASNVMVCFDLNTHPEVVAAAEAVRAAHPSRQPDLRRRMRARRAELERAILQHEAAHLIQHNLGIVPALDRVPTWLSEGLAMQFELPFTRSGHARKAVNAFRLREFGQLHPDPDSLRDLPERLLDDQPWQDGRNYPWAWAVVRDWAQRRPAALASLLTLCIRGEYPSDPDQRQALLQQLFDVRDEAWIARLHAETTALAPGRSGFAPPSGR